MKKGTFKLFPAAPGTCPECAVAHPPELPHNQKSLFYQTKFYIDHHRYPTWDDALKHCSEEMKAAWKEELRKLGVVL